MTRKFAVAAIATIDSKGHYPGPHGSAESHEKSARLIAEWRATVATCCRSRATRWLAYPLLSIDDRIRSFPEG